MDDVGIESIVKIVQIIIFVVKQDYIDNHHKQFYRQVTEIEFEPFLTLFGHICYF